MFTHYGMTEMGLGGGVECEALDGYHLREADLYFEVVNHETGEACPDGGLGEVVFTTLTRQGMPLYDTGPRHRPHDPPALPLRQQPEADGLCQGQVERCCWPGY